MYTFIARRLPAVLIAIVAAGISFSHVSVSNAATPPKIAFDVAQTASCRFVSEGACVKQRPQANIVEVAFDISTRMIAGKESDLDEVTFEITSPGRHVSLAGFLPTTTMQSETADGVISVEEHRIPGRINLEYAGSMAKIQAPIGSNLDTKVVTKKLAPKSLLMASGTIDRAHGVFFTLHPSPQDSLQRAHQFVCYFEVPETFRGDYVQIACRALTHDRSLGGSKADQFSAGAARFTIGIYLDGDSEAKAAADELADQQQNLADEIAAARARVMAKPPKQSISPSTALKNALHIVNKPVAPKNLGLDADIREALEAVEIAKRNLRQLKATEPVDHFPKAKNDTVAAD